MDDSDYGVTDSPKRGPTLSTSTSSFEPFDAHDPNLSRLATKMFQKTGEYISAELSSTVDDYKLIENMNRAMMGKVAEMKQMSESIGVKNQELNRKYEELVSWFKDNWSIALNNLALFSNHCFKKSTILKQL